MYDRVHADLTAEVPAAVALLRSLAPPRGRLLDVGCGTGRLAVPLARAGLQVVGLDISEDMLRVTRAKDPDGRVLLVAGDMVCPPLSGPFDVAVLAFNTLFGLLDPADQRRCITDLARLLGPGGALVVDAAIPQPWRLPADGHDPTAQVITTYHRTTVDGVVHDLPLTIRYVWPDELDDMAAAAGLQRTAVGAGWDLTGAVDAAERLVTVYRLAATAPPQSAEAPCRSSSTATSTS